MYASCAANQAAKNRPAEFTTREARDAYVKTHRQIPPWLLPPAERRRRKVAEDGEHERATPWLVEPIIFPLIERLSRGALGYCNATEYALRLMAWVDTGHLYGERTISRRLRVEARRGRLFRKVIPRGAKFKTGRTTPNGTTSNRFPSEKERRERLWRERNERRRQRREAKRRKRAAKRAERVIAQPIEPAPIEAPRAAGEPRTAIAEVLREECFELPPMLRDVVPGRELEDAARRAREAEVARQLAAAQARPDLWEDEPPD